MLGHKTQIYDLAISPDGNRIFSASADQTIRVWDAKTGQELITLLGHGVQVHGLAISPDGRWLASSDLKGEVRLWDGGPISGTRP
jgi:WD40 repeat protein